VTKHNLALVQDGTNLSDTLKKYARVVAVENDNDPLSQNLGNCMGRFAEVIRFCEVLRKSLVR
jgi:hypothetical protein